MGLLAHIPAEINYLETMAEIFIMPARKNQFLQEDFLTKIQFFRLLLQWKITLPSLDRKLKIRLFFYDLIQYKVEYSVDVSQS